MSLSKSRLGKGLVDLIDSYEEESLEISLDKIEPNAEQPRKHFEESKMKELVDSIAQRGVIQPIILRRTGMDNYEVVAGERRYRAAKELGLKTIPAVIKDVSKETSLELGIVENIHRADLNPIEEIESFQTLINQYGYTQEKIAKVFGQDRSTITNKIRILRLPKTIQNAVATKKITLGHARTLLSLDSESEQINMLSTMLKANMSVRSLEDAVKEIQQKEASFSKECISKPYNKRVSTILTEFLGSKAKIKNKGDKAILEIEVCSEGDLSRIAEMMGLKI